MVWNSYESFTHIHQGFLTALGQSCDCPSASEITLKDMGKIDQHQTTTNHHQTCIMQIIPGIYLLEIWCILSFCFSAMVYCSMHHWSCYLSDSWQCSLVVYGNGVLSAGLKPNILDVNNSLFTSKCFLVELYFGYFNFSLINCTDVCKMQNDYGGLCDYGISCDSY